MRVQGCDDPIGDWISHAIRRSTRSLGRTTTDASADGACEQQTHRSLIINANHEL